MIELPTGYNLRPFLRPGDLGYITYLHGSIYGREHGFDITFEKYVFEPLYDFALCIDNPRQGIRILEKNDTIVGSVAIVEADEEKAQLRWLILIPEVRGKGLGRKLVD